MTMQENRKAKNEVNNKTKTPIRIFERKIVDVV